MSRIADLEREIQEATAAFTRAEHAASAHPNYPSAFITVRSLEKLKDTLIEQFIEETGKSKIDVCSYRIEYQKAYGPAIRGVSSAIGLFQDIFTNSYHALKNGVRKIAKVSAESVDATTLEFAYAFPGSIGIMMTLKSDENLFGESLVDSAMQKTLSLISAKSSDDIDALSSEVGLPTIRLVHKWAQENTKVGFGADIRWRLEDKEPNTRRVQPEEVSALSNLLSIYTQKEQKRVIGALESVNLLDHTFVMSVNEVKISGTFDKAISHTSPAKLPSNYWATLTVATRVTLDDGGEDVSYHLERLEDFDPRVGGPKPDEL